MRRHVALSVALLASSAALGQPAADIPAQSFTLDPMHSTVVFRVSHLGFSDYVAQFDQLAAELDLDPAKPEAAQLTARIPLASIDLPSPPEGFRDYLLGPDWLDAGAHPDITFASTGIRRTGETTAEIDGTLTIRGISQPLTLQARFNGGYPSHPLEPNARIGFSAEGTLSRSAYGMSFGVPPEGSTFGIGDEVEVRIEAEFTGQQVTSQPAE